CATRRRAPLRGVPGSPSRTVARTPNTSGPCIVAKLHTTNVEVVRAPSFGAAFVASEGPLVSVGYLANVLEEPTGGWLLLAVPQLGGPSLERHVRESDKGGEEPCHLGRVLEDLSEDRVKFEAL